MRLKQRIVHLVLREIVADYDAESREVTLVLHWAGGRHSEVHWTKNRMGWAGRSRDLSAVDVVGKMAQEYPDEQIALTLNRKAIRAGCEPGWTAKRVRDIRTKHNIPDFQPRGRQNIACDFTGCRHTPASECGNHTSVNHTEDIAGAADCGVRTLANPHKRPGLGACEARAGTSTSRPSAKTFS